MPCDQYELHLENSVVGPNEKPDVPVASLDQSTSTVTAVQLGHINVVLDHKSILLENHPGTAFFYFIGSVFCIFFKRCFYLKIEFFGFL